MKRALTKVEAKMLAISMKTADDTVYYVQTEEEDRALSLLEGAGYVDAVVMEDDEEQFIANYEGVRALAAWIEAL